MIGKFFIYYHNDIMIDLDLIHGFNRSFAEGEATIDLLSADGSLFAEIQFKYHVSDDDDDCEVLQKIDDVFDELCLFKAMLEYKKENNDTLTVGDMSEFKYLHPLGKYPNLIQIYID